MRIRCSATTWPRCCYFATLQVGWVGWMGQTQTESVLQSIKEANRSKTKLFWKTEPITSNTHQEVLTPIDVHIEAPVCWSCLFYCSFKWDVFVYKSMVYLLVVTFLFQWWSVLPFGEYLVAGPAEGFLLGFHCLQAILGNACNMMSQAWIVMFWSEIHII